MLVLSKKVYILLPKINIQMIQDFPVVVVHANVDRALYEKAALGEAVLFYSSKPVGALRDVPKEELKAQAEYYVPSSRALDLYSLIKSGEIPEKIIGGLQLKAEDPEQVIWAAKEKLKWKLWGENIHRNLLNTMRASTERLRREEEAQRHYSSPGSRYLSSLEGELRATAQAIERLENPPPRPYSPAGMLGDRFADEPFKRP